MFKKIIYVVFLFVICLFMLPVAAEKDCSISINIEETTEIVNVYSFDKKYNLDLNAKKSYRLYSENMNTLSFHILFEDENILFIIYESVDCEIFTCEILIFSKNRSKIENVGMVDLNKKDFIILTTQSEDVFYESEFGMMLRINQNIFEENYYVSLNDSINLFALNRNTKTIEQMTNTDKYLDGYYPSPITETGYPIAYHDRIIDLIPENWFYKDGLEEIFMGKEYGVYVKTKKERNGFFLCDAYTTSVTIWDFENSLPYLHKKENAGYTEFAAENGHSLSIKRAMSYSYWAFDRSYMGEYFWKKYFDITENRIIVQREDSIKPVFLAPQKYAFAIECDSRNNFNLPISEFTYQLNYQDTLSEELRKIELGNFLAESLSELLDYVDIPGLSLVNGVAKCIQNYASTKEKARLRGKAQQLEYDTKLKSIHLDYSSWNNYQGKYMAPISIFGEHSSYSSIFSNKLLDSYEHIYNIRFTGMDLPDELFFSIIEDCIFDVYDYNGKIIDSSERKCQYENLSILLPKQGNHIEVNTLSSQSNFSINLTKTNTSNVFVVKPTITGIYRMSNSNRNMMIEAYDNYGNIIGHTFYNGLESDGLVYMRKNEYYLIRSIFNNPANTTGSGMVSFNLMNSYTTISDSKTIYINGNSHVSYYRLLLSRNGIYRFVTQSSFDTIIRLYDEYGNLLGESDDPNADWSEDFPDLNADLTFYNRPGNRNVIIEIISNQKSSYNLSIIYRNE